jgi:hypothetical protein
MRNLFFLLTLFSVVIFVTESSAGDREDVIADIVQSWKDFALKNPAIDMGHSDGSWVATSEGGFGKFLLAEEFKAMAIDSANIFDFKPQHINVRFVGGKQDSAYATYYLAGNILDSDRNVVVKNYRTRASEVLVKENGRWVSIGSHYSPLFGGSGVVFD